MSTSPHETKSFGKSRTVSLSQPLMTIKGEIKEIVITEPKARHIVAFGDIISESIVREGDKVRIERAFNHSAVAKYVSACTPYSFEEIDIIPAGDWKRLSNALLEMFDTPTE